MYLYSEWKDKYGKILTFGNLSEGYMAILCTILATVIHIWNDFKMKKIKCIMSLNWICVLVSVWWNLQPYGEESWGYLVSGAILRLQDNLFHPTLTDVDPQYLISSSFLCYAVCRGQLSQINKVSFLEKLLIAQSFCLQIPVLGMTLPLSHNSILYQVSWDHTRACSFLRTEGFTWQQQ